MLAKNCSVNLYMFIFFINKPNNPNIQVRFMKAIGGTIENKNSVRRQHLIIVITAPHW